MSDISTDERGLFDPVLAHAIDSEDGWLHAPGDADTLPDDVRALVDRAAEDADRSPGEYWVKYRPALDLYTGELGDEHEVMIVPAKILRGPDTIEVAVDEDVFGSLRIGFAALAEKLTELFEAQTERLRPAMDAFGQVVYFTEGHAPEHVTDAAAALAALAHAETTTIVRRVPKPLRRRAKHRYLEVKRHLAPEHRDRLKAVPVNRFGAM